MINQTPFLDSIVFKKEKVEDYTVYPFYLNFLKEFSKISFHPNVTFFIGENGSGKSTLLESIANLFNINSEGGNKNTTFSTKDTSSELYKYLKPIKTHRYPKDWYFLRAESFYNLSTYMDDKPEFLESYGGKSLHEQSHGESFFTTLQNKLRGEGFYLFDEPEAALSPMRQLSAISIIDKLVKKNSQLIIATHSPILLAYPNAKIYEFSNIGINEVLYENTQHYQVTKDFLNQYEKMTNILINS